LLRNNGDTDWPEGCHLINIKPKSNEQADRPPQMFPVPSIKPNDTVTVNAVFKTPTYLQVLEMWNREIVKPAPNELTQQWAVCRTEWTISTADNSTTIGQVLICNVWVAKTPAYAQWLRQNGQNEQMFQCQQAQQQQPSLPLMEMDDLTRCINGLPQAISQQFFQVSVRRYKRSFGMFLNPPGVSFFRTAAASPNHRRQRHPSRPLSLRQISPTTLRCRDKNVKKTELATAFVKLKNKKINCK
jgi:hypothetical protein